MQVDNTWRSDAGRSPDFQQLRGLEKAAGIVQRRPLRKVGIVVVSKELIADFSRTLSDVCRLSEHGFLRRIGLGLMYG